MEYISTYGSPLGEILLAADEEGLCGLWFFGQRHFARGLGPAPQRREVPVLLRAKAWLDRYFAGEAPAADVPLHLVGTAFQREVWQLLREIPYGQTVTYGELARRTPGCSPRAVGGAVGRNPVSLLVPCHRVVGAGGRLTGYAGGLERKAQLLALEQAPCPR